MSTKCLVYSFGLSRVVEGIRHLGIRFDSPASNLNESTPYSERRAASFSRNQPAAAGLVTSRTAPNPSHQATNAGQLGGHGKPVNHRLDPSLPVVQAADENGLANGWTHRVTRKPSSDFRSRIISRGSENLYAPKNDKLQLSINSYRQL